MISIMIVTLIMQSCDVISQFSVCVLESHPE